MRVGANQCDGSLLYVTDFSYPSRARCELAEFSHILRVFIYSHQIRGRVCNAHRRMRVRMPIKITISIKKVREGQSQ
jgi:hypothetical protein